MFERFPAMVAQIQRLYYASALVHDVRPGQAWYNDYYLVDVAEGAEWSVPRLCLRFVAMLKHHKVIKAWATRARHAANVPGGTGAEAARRSFQGARGVSRSKACSIVVVGARGAKGPRDPKSERFWG